MVPGADSLARATLGGSLDGQRAGWCSVLPDMHADGAVAGRRMAALGGRIVGADTRVWRFWFEPPTSPRCVRQ